MIKGAIFDMDGTLLDSMGMWNNVGVNYLISLDIEPEPELISVINHMSTRQVANYLIDTYHVDKTADKIVHEIEQNIEYFYRNEVMTKPYIREFLDKFRAQGIKMCVATATNKAMVRVALNRCGISDYFTEIFTTEDSGVGKNKPDIYEMALKCLGTDKDDTVVFEDLLVPLTTAKNAGFKTCAVQDEFNDDEYELRKRSDYYLESFAEYNEFSRAFDRRCVIIGGAAINNYNDVKKYLKPDDYAIFCDSGLKHMDGLGIKPDLIVGDFDSCENPKLDVETIELPCEKDDTDTVYGMKEGLKREYNSFLLLGVVGNRFDHTMGNVSILLKLDSLGKKAMIVDDYSEMQIVSDKPAYISDEYQYFSLLNISGEAKDIHIENAKYILNGAEITCEYQYGVSNEVLPGQTARVSVGKGRLLLIKDR